VAVGPARTTILWLPAVLPIRLLWRLPARLLFLHTAIPRIEITAADLAMLDQHGAGIRWAWEDIEALEVNRWCVGRLVGRAGSRGQGLQPATVSRLASTVSKTG
jgi:hypothetical protein